MRAPMAARRFLLGGTTAPPVGMFGIGVASCSTVSWVDVPMSAK